MAVKEEWDDVSDLNSSEMSSVTEWKEQFDEKYDYVGRLVQSEADIVDRASDVADVDDSSENIAQDAGKSDLPTKPSNETPKSSDSSDVEIIDSN